MPASLPDEGGDPLRIETVFSRPLERLQAMTKAIMPDGAVAVCRDVKGDVSRLFVEERAAIERAVARRQAEFSAGRAAARAALQQLGRPPVAIPVGPGRAPLWPAGITGSISHCRSAVIAVASAFNVQVGHIGIDVEEAGTLERELWEAICTPKEISELVGLTDAGRCAKVIFSIKEAVYKAQYPVTERLLDFQQVEISSLDPSGRFTAQILVGKLKSVGGRCQTSNEFILAFAAAQRPQR